MSSSKFTTQNVIGEKRNELKHVQSKVGNAKFLQKLRSVRAISFPQHSQTNKGGNHISKEKWKTNLLHCSVMENY